jgi:hypothetical protein
VNLGLEDRHGLAADPHRRHARLGKLELHVHAAGAMQRVPLHAGKARAVAIAAQQPQLGEETAQQAMGVAAHRILGDAERRAEHARLSEVVGVAFQREDEVAGGTELGRQRREARHVRLEALQSLRGAHPDQQARSVLARDAQRHARIETPRVEGQGIEHRETLAVVELAAKYRGALANGDAPLLVAAAHFDVDDPRLGLLALAARRVMSP